LEASRSRRRASCRLAGGGAGLGFGFRRSDGKNFRSNMEMPMPATNPITAIIISFDIAFVSP
jgi:hypothetical protein